ncbi:DUF1559 domain-containing protein [Fuerstiella marisgermanici]|uniref:Type II secretion system protein G n=1 Tax=Fuerstiella marisgermanici TaxID=1891926 RepID=A0A1P8WNY1_9PLAN|nr:DUF1559 domain-containing protein [Fuerstiella marisgermanici]APZ95748.1 type II secretion system protein G [Fuerstiella marisgermanici]
MLKTNSGIGARSTNRRRAGFTLIELLVVISIIATLMSLILPAIQNAREAGRRTQCLNNIRNVTVALLNFASSNKSRLPALSYYNRNPGSMVPSFSDGRSWVVEVLPFMDQQGTYDRWDNALPWDSAVVNSNGARNINLAGELYIEALACPNDESAFSIPGGLSYVANAGFGDSTVGADEMVQDPGHSFHAEDFDWDSNGTTLEVTDTKLTRDTGVFWSEFGSVPSTSNPSATIGKIYDGSGNTIMLSENINAGQGNWANPSLNSCGMMYPISGAPSTPGQTDRASNAVLGNTPTAILPGTQPYINQRKTGPEGAPFPSSNHPGIVVVSMCDGSAKTISENLDEYVYTQLLTPSASRLRTLATATQFVPEKPVSADSF